MIFAFIQISGNCTILRYNSEQCSWVPHKTQKLYIEQKTTVNTFLLKMFFFFLTDCFTSYQECDQSITCMNNNYFCLTYCISKSFVWCFLKYHFQTHTVIHVNESDLYMIVCLIIWRQFESGGLVCCFVTRHIPGRNSWSGNALMLNLWRLKTTIPWHETKYSVSIQLAIWKQFEVDFQTNFNIILKL